MWTGGDGPPILAMGVRLPRVGRGRAIHVAIRPAAMARAATIDARGFPPLAVEVAAHVLPHAIRIDVVLAAPPRGGAVAGAGAGSVRSPERAVPTSVLLMTAVHAVAPEVLQPARVTAARIPPVAGEVGIPTEEDGATLPLLSAEALPLRAAPLAVSRAWPARAAVEAADDASGPIKGVDGDGRPEAGVVLGLHMDRGRPRLLSGVTVGEVEGITGGARGPPIILSVWRDRVVGRRPSAVAPPLVREVRHAAPHDEETVASLMGGATLRRQPEVPPLAVLPLP